MKPKTNRELEDRCINTIRILSADAVQNANSRAPPDAAGRGSFWNFAREKELYFWLLRHWVTE